MAAMEPMAAVYVAHAAHAAPIAHATDVTPTETEAAGVTSAEAATTEATPTEATAMTAATATTAAASTSTSTVHQHQQTVLCIQIGVVGIARLSERCRGSKSKRKSAADTKRDDAAFHDAPLLAVKFVAPRKSIGDIFNWRPIAAIGIFPERGVQAKVSLWLTLTKPCGKRPACVGEANDRAA
jgi:hypothetical protein